ncbi:MAG: hypothetical protein FWD97_08370 [Defluviitaleaceae bacterium]|nr:hypothetical protein [Defluviitaleaceae bacterium]
MIHGFSGLAAFRYLGDVTQAHETASSSAAQSQAGAPPNSPPIFRGSLLPFRMEDAKTGRHVTGQNTSSNIVVSQTEYNDMVRRISEVDDKMGRCLYQVASEIEAMCQTMFIMPAAVPRCLNVSGTIKSSLGEFRSVTEDSALEILGFVRDIDGIGR